MVAVGGFRTTINNIYSFGNYAQTLTKLRTQASEIRDIQTRKSYKTLLRNFGDLDSEMTVEFGSLANPNNVATPNSGTVYNLRAGTPLFVEAMRGDSVKYIGMVANGAAGTTIPFGDQHNALLPGDIVEINGERRTVQTVGAGSFTIDAALSVNPPAGSLVLVRGYDIVNPHVEETFRITDKYGSRIIDNNRYQVDRATGNVRYRPTAGTLANSVWHQDNQLQKPYYFGRAIDIKETPPPAGPTTDGVANNETLGEVDDPVASGSNGAAAAPNVTTNLGRVYPDGEFSNIRITAAAGVSFEVDINGAKMAVQSAGGAVTIPFFDPDYTNDSLKANDSIDPDIYIQRFLKEGQNVISIKAIATADGNNDGTPDTTGIRVEGIFNGVDLSTNNSPTSVNPKDWSASQHSVLGIAGKVTFELQDRIGMEDIGDEMQIAQGVLESLTTLIANQSNQFESILSVLR